MSSELAIRLRGVSKCYQTYDKPLHRLYQMFTTRRLYEQFWAVRDVRLDISAGETVGIVGRNGSGKSTLLQLIVGTLTPTTGSIQCSGRISAILELGAGFNPDFTGIENARLNAAIVGMPGPEIEERLPAIIRFSELEDFIHKPVKTYSSGMTIRLAFSVVINLNPGILVIDEALAVGDSRFQRKCFRKLDELRDKGTTILFVTHATDSVIAHCDRAVFMEQGRIVATGEPKRIVNQYLESLFDKRDGANSEAGTAAVPGPKLPAHGLSREPRVDACRHRPWYNDTEYEWGDGGARIFDFVVLNADGWAMGLSCPSGQTVSVLAAVYIDRPQDGLIFGLTIKTVDGTTVFGTNTEKLGQPMGSAQAGKTVRIRIEITLSLISSEYFFSLGIVSRDAGTDEHVLHRRYDLFRLRIEDDQRAFGYASLPASITVLENEAQPA